MRNESFHSVTVGGVDYSEYFAYPFTIQKTLDETLDYAFIELKYMKKQKPFKPMTPVVIGKGETAMSFLLISDEVSEIFGRKRYNHVLNLMEDTKEIELITCGAKAFTNPLVRDYADGATFSYGFFATWIDSGTSGMYNIFSSNLDEPMVGELFTSPITNTGKFPIYADFGVMNFAYNLLASEYTVEVYYSNKSNIKTTESSSYERWVEIVGTKIYEGVFDSSSTGLIADVDVSTYGVGQYLVLFTISSINNNDHSCVMTEISVTKSPVSRDPYTVEDVVNQLLDTCETLRVGLDTPRYQLRYKDDTQRSRFLEDAPEFRFANNRSLWECLREVGQYVHAIPRIVRDIDTGAKYLEFDELGGTVYADLTKGQCYGHDLVYNIGNYTVAIESMAENLVNVDDLAEGSLSEPFGKGYMSMRAETETARIEEETGFIKTTYPIEKLLNVQVGRFKIGDNEYAGGNITPYIFEKSEYDLLSSYTGNYPYSKTYALYYTHGAQNIQGLWYKAQDTGSSLLDALQDYSITNVITAATGAVSGIFREAEYTDLMFRVTYIPSVTARVRQYKSTYDGSFPAVIVQNQAANKLSSKSLGERMRGQLAMMGEYSESLMYLFKRQKDVPEPGTLYDDTRYISSVLFRSFKDFTIAQINLSVGYNELGSRVELNNAIRQFEIPDSEDRYTVLEEFCVVGKKDADDDILALTDYLKKEVVRAFAVQAKGYDVSLAKVTTYDDDGDALTTPPVALPVISLSLGNSLYFGWRFESNHAAGSKSSEGGDHYRIQDYVSYSDPYYAQAHSVGFKLLAGATTTDALGTAHDLPESTAIEDGTVMVNTGDYPILWHKDSADAGCLTYQLHYVTNDDLIIGDGLAYHCAAVRTTPNTESAYIYFYDRRINQLTGTTDTTNYIAVYQILVDITSCYLTYVGFPNGFKSWAIIKGGKFMLGKNTSVAPDKIYFNFKRRLEQ